MQSLSRTTNNTFQETRSYHPLNIDTLFLSRENFETENNVVMFESVQNLIKTTHHFDNIRLLLSVSLRKRYDKLVLLTRC
jgi:hypothetical protein